MVIHFEITKREKAKKNIFPEIIFLKFSLILMIF